MFAQLWNGFLLSLPAVQGGVGHRHLPLLVINFARWVQVEAGEDMTLLLPREKAADILASSLYRNFCAHLSLLEGEGVVGQQDVGSSP